MSKPTSKARPLGSSKRPTRAERVIAGEKAPMRKPKTIGQVYRGK